MQCQWEAGWSSPMSRGGFRITRTTPWGWWWRRASPRLLRVPIIVVTARPRVWSGVAISTWMRICRGKKTSSSLWALSSCRRWQISNDASPLHAQRTSLPRLASSPLKSASFQPPLPMIHLLLGDPRALKPALPLKTSKWHPVVLKNLTSPVSSQTTVFSNLPSSS